MKANHGMISEAQMVGKIVGVLRARPDLVQALPAGCTRPSFWRELLGRTDETRRVMLLLRELPAFTEWAATPALRKKMLRADPGEGMAHILRDIVLRANRKPAQRRPIRRWRDAFGPNEKNQRVRPVESFAWLPNPHRGTTTFQRFQGDPLYPTWFSSDTHGPLEFPKVRGRIAENIKYTPRTTLSYCRWPWAVLEPRKGKYRWDIIDGALRAAREHGQTLQARFEPFTDRVDFDTTPCKSKRHPPERSVNVPDWYWDTGARWIRKGPFAANEPDSNDPHYLKHFGDFVRAFAKRYDGHPDLESIDVAYAGMWGEEGGNATPGTAKKLVDVYRKGFRRTQLVSMLGTAGCTYAAKRTAGTNQHVGWRADCYGDLRRPDHPAAPRGLTFNHTFDAYPRQIEQCGVKDAWQHAPVTMETCWWVATWYLDGYDLDVVVREGLRYHTSVFMPKSVIFPAATRPKMEELDRLIGYRFALRQMVLPLEAARGARIKMSFFVDNVGCAPIYRPYRLALRFRQRGRSVVVPLKADIRQWMPGHTWFDEPVVVPRTLRREETWVDLAIVGDDGRPRVWFALDARTADGWHPIARMDVITPR